MIFQKLSKAFVNFIYVCIYACMYVCRYFRAFKIFYETEKTFKIEIVHHLNLGKH